MRPLNTLLACLILLASTPLHAGAWLREQGRTFLSSTFSATYFRDIANESYIEHGWRDDITIGADVGFYTLHTGLQTGQATVFIRRPLKFGAEKSVWSYEIGIGAYWIADQVSPTIKTGVSWGRGFTFAEKSGWMNVDASVTWDLGQSLHTTKIDSTVGINLTEKFTGMLQVFSANVGGETFHSLAPSIVFAPKSNKLRLQVGALAPLDNLDSTAIRLGIWREF